MKEKENEKEEKEEKYFDKLGRKIAVMSTKPKKTKP